jgi:flagellar hook protein FlgE
MLQGLFNGLSGLFGFSRDLDKIGNNISNMNTPGFRGQRAFFENAGEDIGSRLSQDVTDLSQGNTEQTGTSTDAAIQGKGLFVLRDGQGNLFYTREGHFQFDANGYLVDDVTGYRVAALNASNGLADFNIASQKTLPAQATTAVNFTGNLSTQDASQQVTGIQVYDSSGGVHPLTATLTNNKAVTPNSWTVSVKDSAGAEVGTGEVRFDGAGTPQAGFSTVAVQLSVNGATQNVSFNFGTPGGFSGATQLNGNPSNIGAKAADGHAAVGTSQLSFDDTGTLQITYTDNEKKPGPQLALAQVADEQLLQPEQGALYTAGPDVQLSYGKANQGLLGKIVGGSLEQSNVDLTRELTEMIIVQRGYQASSRVLTVTDSMLQQLYSSTGGGGGG